MCLTFNKNCVDVYELILERGTIGALLYANEIENKNIKLANEIDRVVNGLLRTSQYVGPRKDVPYNQNTVREMPSAPSAPSAGSGKLDPKIVKQLAPQDQSFYEQYLNLPLGASRNLYLYKLAELMIKRGKIAYDKGISKLIKMVEDGGAEAEPAAAKLSEIIAKSSLKQPLEKWFENIKSEKLVGRAEIIKAVQDSGLDGGVKADIINSAAHQFEKKQNLLSNVTKKIPFTRPTPNTLLTNIAKSQDLPDDVVKSLQGEDPSKWVNILKNNKVDDTIIDGVKNVLSSSSSDISKGILVEPEAAQALAAVSNAAAEAQGPLANALNKVLGVLKNPAVAKILGVLAVAFEAHEVYEDITKYGWDFKTIYDIAQTVATTLSLFPATAPVAIPVSLALGFGSFLVHHDPKDDKTSNDFKPEDVVERMKNITFNDLTASDKQKLISTAENCKKNNADFRASVSQGLDNHAFEHPLDVTAITKKFMDQDPSIIPGADPSISDVPQTSNSKPATTSNFKFNLKKYSTAY